MDISLDQLLMFSLSTKAFVRALQELKKNLGTDCHLLLPIEQAA